MRVFFMALLGCVLLSGLVSAQATPEQNELAIDTVWVLVAAFLVFFMQAGFAMVETGFTRAKNAGNILMKNLMDFSAGSLAYFAVGFALMFGAGNAFFGGTGFFLSDPGVDFPVSLYTFWIFQVVFAATAATIVSGAVAERIKFNMYLVYSVVISALIYPVVGHWIWGGGWLSSLPTPMIDFAGSTVVHSVGGWAALAGAIVLGPRIGKYASNGKPNAIKGHSLTLAALGVFILWFGWYGFNPGSALSAGSDLIAIVAITTTLAASSGATAAMFFTRMKYGRPDIGMSMNGALAGLVAITAGCANVSPLGSVAIGALAGILVVLSVEFFDKLRIDDPVGAVSVHGVCGSFGTIMVGFFADPSFGGVRGFLYGGGFDLLVTQMLGFASVFIWAFGAAFLMFKTIDVLFGLRVSSEEELKGLDLSEHNAEAYADFTITATTN